MKLRSAHRDTGTQGDIGGHVTPLGDRDTGHPSLEGVPGVPPQHEGLKRAGGTKSLTVALADGRRFERVSFEPYTRADGSRTELAVWLGTCALCGAPFTVTTPAHTRAAGQSKAFGRKHCDAHKRTPAAYCQAAGREVAK